MKTIDRINLNGTEYIIQDTALTEEVREIADRILNTYTKTEVNTLLENYLSKIEAHEMVANYAAVSGTTLTLNNENITV